MIPIDQVIVTALLLALIHMSAYYVLSMIKRDTSIVDIVWGLGFALIAAVLIPQVEDPSTVHWLVMICVIAWGLRLASHIFVRKAGEPEDWRYQQWRKDWGATHWWRSYLQVFVLQGLLQAIIAAPIIVVAANGAQDSLTPLQIAGGLLWALGFYFEAVGDWQLSRFIAKKRAQAQVKQKSAKKKQPTIMKTGLWRYTRHPNYFGEITQWWGLFLVVVQLEYGLFAIVSPLLITFLLLKVSGITMLEKKYDDNKEYQKYKKRTSALIPLPPKN